jgi:glycosyltransferase involved in cell wall biosynthesis
MFNSKKISLVIPCKNEEKIIANTIKNIPTYVDEIIVVDNGSSDNSALVAQEAGAIVVKEPRKLNGVGYGYAHLSGIQKATGDYIFGMDADDTYPSYEISNIVNYMENGEYDVVSCNRLPLINSKAISKLRRLGIYVLNLEIFALYGYPIKDSLTGMWGIKKSCLPKLNLRMGDWNLSPEVKISAIMNKGIKFGEYHIDHFVREKEPSKQAIWKTGWGHFRYIAKKRFTEDSSLGGVVYKILINRRWSQPVFAGNKITFAL